MWQSHYMLYIHFNLIYSLTGLFLALTKPWSDCRWVWRCVFCFSSLWFHSSPTGSCRLLLAPSKRELDPAPLIFLWGAETHTSRRLMANAGNMGKGISELDMSSVIQALRFHIFKFKINEGAWKRHNYITHDKNIFSQRHASKSKVEWWTQFESSELVQWWFASFKNADDTQILDIPKQSLVPMSNFAVCSTGTSK